MPSSNRKKEMTKVLIGTIVVILAIVGYLFGGYMYLENRDLVRVAGSTISDLEAQVEELTLEVYTLELMREHEQNMYQESRVSQDRLEQENDRLRQNLDHRLAQLRKAGL